MLTIKEIDQKEFELCYELDSDTICLWTKKQWQSEFNNCLLYTSPSPRDRQKSRMPSSA